MAHVFTFTEIFISSYGFELPNFVLSFQSTGLLSVLLLTGMSSGSELPQLVFIWECLRTVLLDMYQPTAFCPSNFHMRNLLIIYWRSLVQDELLLSCSFQILPLSLTFDSLFIMCLDVGLLSSFYLEFVELLGCSYSCLFSHFGKFWPLFL